MPNNVSATPHRTPADTTLDRLLGGRVTLKQPAEGYRVALDPVLLAAAVDPPQGGRVLDLGCGVGAAALCLLARRSDLTVLGLELQPELAGLAAENAALNEAKRFHVLQGDAAAAQRIVPAGTFDAVLSNPPHLAATSGRATANASRDLAHLESSLDLGGWIKAALSWLKPRGTLTLVHRADRLPELLTALRKGAGAIRICPLWPRAGEPAKRVLLAATKASRAPARLLPGLVLHEGTAFSAAAEAVLRHGAALDLGA
ncbi:MAG TPA: methyltransferase [Kiloniellales bacterium]|nr:methyltransferase [Kiloniellales bacterium]